MHVKACHRSLKIFSWKQCRNLHNFSKTIIATSRPPCGNTANAGSFTPRNTKEKPTHRDRTIHFRHFYPSHGERGNANNAAFTRGKTLTSHWLNASGPMKRQDFPSCKTAFTTAFSHGTPRQCERWRTTANKLNFN